MISTDVNRVEFQGNGSSAVIPYAYPVHAQAHLAVFAFNSSASSPALITPLVLNAAGPGGYTLSGNADSTGVYKNGVFVNLNSSPNAETVIVMMNSSPLTSTFEAGRTGVIPAPALNNILDYLFLIAQRQQQQITRAIVLHDGLAGSFDTRIPSNVKSSAGKRIMVNSSGTAFTFDESVGAYVQNTMIFAATNSSLQSLGGAASGLYLQSNGSSAPTWGAVNISSATVSAGAIVGVLPQSVGGTGNTSYVVGGLIFQETAFQFGTIDTAAPPGYLLTANSGAVPTFQAFAATNINSGTLAVAVGGTGLNSLTPSALIFASTASVVAQVPVGGTDIPLLGNNGDGPTFRPLPLGSGSSVTGTLPVARGGTNQTAMIAGTVLYGSGITQVGMAVVGVNQVVLGGGSSAPTSVTGYGSSGTHVLTSNGDGAAPTWQPATGGFANPMTASGDLIVGSGAGSPSRLALGGQNMVLMSHGSTSQGATWRRPPSPKITNLGTSANATFTVTPQASFLRIRMVGGGGSGGWNGADGNPGAATIFGTSFLTPALVCTPGGGAAAGGAPSAGGLASGGDLNFPGAGGGGASNGGGGAPGGNGGCSFFSGNGVGGAGGTPGAAAGSDAAPNSGSGGGGSCSSNIARSGGGAGGYLEKVIVPTASSYIYTVGDGGVKPASFCGSGGSGRIIIEEYFI